MNKENASKLWKIIQEAGDYLRHPVPGLYHMMLLKEADRVLKVLKKFITANYPSIPK